MPFTARTHYGTIHPTYLVMVLSADIAASHTKIGMLLAIRIIDDIRPTIHAGSLILSTILAGDHVLWLRVNCGLSFAKTRVTASEWVKLLFGGLGCGTELAFCTFRANLQHYFGGASRFRLSLCFWGIGYILSVLGGDHLGAIERESHLSSHCGQVMTLPLIMACSLTCVYVLCTRIGCFSYNLS
jgi:hypothetical protein